jgi:hypothetical protein
VEEFLKTYLKNKRSYARKQGYLTEKTNQKPEQSDDDDDEQQEEEERLGGKDKGKGKEIPEYDSETENLDVPDDDAYGSEPV